MGQYNSAGDDTPETPETSAENPASSDDRNADRRDARSRARLLQRMFEELEVEPSLAAEIVSDLSSLLPPQHRMSRDEDVAVRLKALLDRDAKAPPSLQMRQSGAEIDVANEGTVRSTEKLTKLVQDGDERLLQSYVANERLRAVLARQIAEHDAARNVLVAELARRYTINEQWRYKLPKFMMPLVAVMLKAGVKRDDLRLGNTLLGAIIDLIVKRARATGVARDALVEAAEDAEEMFSSFVPDEAERGREGASESEEVEPFEHAVARLKPEMEARRKAVWKAKGCAETEAAFQPFAQLYFANGGLDKFGRPVFENLQTFHEAVEHLRQETSL